MLFPPSRLSELEEINSDVLLDLKIRTYSYLSKTMQLKKSELLLASLLKIHFDKCQDVLCTCKRRRYLYDPKKLEAGGGVDQLHKDTVFVKHFINKMIQDGIKKKYRESKLLRLDLIFWEFEALKL